MARVFLSYRSTDREAALAVERAIVQVGHEVFLDDPEAAIVISLAAAAEYGSTPRVIRCLHEALMWHCIEAPLGEHELKGLRRAHLLQDGAVITVSADVAEPPPRASTRRVPQPSAPVISKLFVRRWNVGEREPEWTVAIPGTQCTSIAASASVVAISTDQGTSFVASASGALQRVDPSMPRVLALSSGGGLAASVVADGFEVRTVDTGRLVRALSAGSEDDEITKIRFSESGEHVACQTRGGFGGEWVVESGHRVMQSGDADVSWPEPLVVIASLPPEQREWSNEVVEDRSITWDHTRVVVWQLRQPGPVLAEQRILEAAVDAASAETRDAASKVLAVSRSGRQLLDAPLRIVGADGHAGAALDFHSGVRGAAFSANGKWLAICNLTSISVYDAESGKRVGRFGQHDEEEGDTYSALAVSDNGGIVVSGSLAGGRSYIWNTTTGERVHKIGAILVAIDASGQLVVAGHHAKAWLVRVADGRTLTELPSGIVGVSTPPRRRLSEKGFSARIASFDFGQFSSRVTALALSRTADLAAIGTSEWTVLCNLPSGEPLCAWDIAAFALIFGPGDRTLGIVDPDGKTMIVAIPDFDALVALARRSVLREPTPEERVSFGFGGR